MNRLKEIIYNYADIILISIVLVLMVGALFFIPPKTNTEENDQIDYTNEQVYWNNYWLYWSVFQTQQTFQILQMNNGR